jgi:hypothetical protein
MSDPTTNSPSHSDACAFVRDNAAAFALRALTPEETSQIVRHLEEHPACQRYIDAELAVVELLPFSMPLIEAPDLAVRIKLFDTIDAERQTPLARYTDREPARFFAPRQHPAPESLRTAPAPAMPPNRWPQVLGSVLLAPLCIALLVMSVWAYNLNDEVKSLRDANTAADSPTMMEVYAMTSSCTDCSTHGQIGAMPDQTSAILLAWDLDPAEDHEVWCEERDGNKWMVSSLNVNANGAAMQTIKFPKPIDGYSRIYVSGSDNDEGEDPELLVAMPEQHEDNPPSESTPAA